MDIKSKLCRFCLFQERGNANKLIHMPEEYLHNKIKKIGIIISSEDNIPPLACEICLSFIEKIYNFFETIHNSEQVLIELHKSETSGAIADAKRKLPADPSKFEVIKEPNRDFDSSISNIEVILSQEIIDNTTPNVEHLNLPGDHSDDCESVNSRIYIEKFKNTPFTTIQFSDDLYHCDICLRNFDAFFDYQDHQESHNGQLVFYCSKCDQVLSRRGDLVEHENNHKVSCNICQTEVLPKSFDAHMKKHTDVFRCHECGSRHSSRAAMETHIKARHAGVKGYVCHICGRQNSCQASMNRHLAIHLKFRPCKCKLCSFATKSKTILKVHVARKHSNEKSTCESCGKLFKSKLSLKQHKKRIHVPKKYACKRCGKNFSERFNLNQHVLKKHSKQRVYECKICRQEYFTTQNLKNHMYSHRTGCVNCLKCGKIFTYKKYLEKHLQKCTNERNTDSINNVVPHIDENK